MNRYHTIKFGRHPLLSPLRRLAWTLLRRPRLGQLGADSYIVRPFRCSHPERVRIGAHVSIGAHCNLQAIDRYHEQRFEPLIAIGDDCYVGVHCQLHCIDSIRIGNGCVLSDHVYLADVAHGLDPTAGHILDQPLTSKGPVSIGNHCFIGFGAAILPAVTLGDHCVVGARAVVTRPFPGYSMVAGNPARLVARFDPATRRWQPVEDPQAAALPARPRPRSDSTQPEPQTRTT